jgi:hypothetical protein
LNKKEKYLMASTTKRDWKALAGIAKYEWKRNFNKEQYETICKDLAFFLVTTNKNFDKEQFLRDCEI